MEKSNEKVKVKHGVSAEEEVHKAAKIQEEIDVEMALIRSQYTSFAKEYPWVLERRAANDAVSVRAFRRRLCGSLTSRRARRTVTRVIADPSIMRHVYIPEPED